jgi:hypothetical protein
MAAGNVTYVKGLSIEPWGQIPYLWATFFAFGNLFALFWLSRAFLNAHPEIVYQAKQTLGRLGLRRSKRQKKPAARSSSLNGDGTGAEIMEAAGDEGAHTGKAVLPASTSNHHHISQPQDLCTEQATAGAPMDHAGGFGSATDSSSSSASDDASDVQLHIVRLDWRNICYSVKTSRGRKMILQVMFRA